jgi:hypothetical protein
LGSDTVELPPVPLWSTVRVALLSIGLNGVLAGRSADAAWVERVFVNGWGGAVSTALGRASAHVPGSLAELLTAALAAWLLWIGLAAASDVASGRRPWHHAALCGVLTVVRVTAALWMVFYVVWGTAYARPPAFERHGWPTPDPRLPEARMQLVVEAAHAVMLANQYRALAAPGLDAVPLVIPETFDVDAAIDRGFADVAARMALPDAFARSRGPAKVPRASVLLSWLGIGGIYVPFTGEATVNGMPPAFSRILTTAHEKAHQRMVAREDEANFYGFLAAVHADEPMLRYAAWEFAARQLLRALDPVEPELARAIRGLRSPGVRADLDANAAFWVVYEGWMERLSEWINDWYLKSNRVPGGVLAYGRAGGLIVAWLDTPAGRELSGLPSAVTRVLVPPPEAARPLRSTGGGAPGAEGGGGEGPPAEGGPASPSAGAQ